MKKQLLFCSILLLTALVLAAPSGPESEEITSGTVVYHKTDSLSVEGHLAKPAAPGSHPAVILIHEWWGLNDDIRRRADEFARNGYVALTADLYNGESTTERTRARELAGSVRNDIPGAFENLESAIAFLKKDAAVDSTRIAAIGWCFGGGWSYQMAKNDLGVRASVIYYGRFNPEDDLAKMRAEILGHFAEKDRGISIDNVNEFQAKLKTLNGDHEIYIYPNTTHGFASRPGENPNYVEDAARLADERTLIFLKKALQK